MHGRDGGMLRCTTILGLALVMMLTNACSEAESDAVPDDFPIPVAADEGGQGDVGPEVGVGDDDVLPPQDTGPPPPLDTGPPPPEDTGPPPPQDTGPPPPEDTGPPPPEDTGPPPPPGCEATEIDGRLVHGDAPPLVMIDPGCGKLSYGRYAAEGQVEAVHLLPDFSYAGYRGGGVPIPSIPAVETVSPGPGDDRAAIQAAIDAVSALPVGDDGFRGAVELTAGTYQVGDTLTIAAGGVVLRGAGQGTRGTVLVATKKAQHALISLAGTGKGLGGCRQDELARG